MTMNEKGIIIPNLALAGYRSFGKEPQYFDQFAKINLFIGQNNAGKSNVLRFLNDIYPHVPDSPPLLLGVGERVDKEKLPFDHELLTKNLSQQVDKEKRSMVADLFLRVMKRKTEIENQQICWTLIYLNLPKITSPQMLGRKKFENEETWHDAIKILSDKELYGLFNILMGVAGTNRNDDWEPQVIKKMQLSPVQIQAKLIPAIRRIGEKGSSSDTFDGTGIIDRLARLQNPDVHSQHEKERFNEITNFLCDVVDRPNAVS